MSGKDYITGIFPGEDYDLGSKAAGYGKNSQGRGYCSSNGGHYHSDVKQSQILQSCGSGSYVGVEVNMNTKKVRWSVNGRKSVEKDILFDSCFVGVSIYYQYEAIEILPKFCWSK